MAEVTETARRRVQTLVENWDWPDPAILDGIVALGEEAVPALEELLTPALLKQTCEDGRADSIVFYSMIALSELRLPASLPFLVSLFAEVDDDLVDALPDFVRPFGPAAIEPLLALTTNEALGWYPRSLAAEVAVGLAGTDAAAKQRIADQIRPIVADYLDRYETLDEEQQETVSALASELVDLTDAEARPMLEQALADGKINEDQFDLEYLEEVYRDGKEQYSLPFHNSLEQYRKDYRNRLQEQETKAKLSVLDQKPASQTVILSPKIGRNEPCWCGSGQKYKKCHLAQDEKERVRL